MKPIVQPKRIVIKLGTGVLTTGIGKLDAARIAALCSEIAAFRASGVEVIVVSSAAGGLGMGRLGLEKRPRDISKKQACAAIGQSLLMQYWQDGFDPHGLTAAQVLLTHEDMRGRERYLGVKKCLETLIDYGTIPVINENDAVSAAEIKFGDNDTLSAMVASLVGAQYLFILSTAPGLVDMKGTGKIVPVVNKITAEIEEMAGGTTSITATGGMISKIAAAKLAMKSGCGVFIASGAEPEIMHRLLAGTGPGTFFVPSGIPMESKKRWLAYFQRPVCAISVKDDAVPALRERGRSLLAVGVTGATGVFAAGEIVNVTTSAGVVIARGKISYGSEDIAKIAGKHGDEMRALYPARKHLEVMHRDEMVVL
ncbi:glutamate 5-kinase [Ereboglobus sp. PH5-5]|uniref:glutamate 5-kinase n=1 Tax=Ereboglobus sp. PH5-5 TaxID=2940529 RepID=UPI0024074E8B|nr:glutamate 5-kinase [Ereboglobus sp. PH5-5]MDF9832208.1 glutamate 5-kinase [Ereboglobus sp. PH5-5]